jgi:hypothetical protein
MCAGAGSVVRDAGAWPQVGCMQPMLHACVCCSFSGCAEAVRRSLCAGAGSAVRDAGTWLQIDAVQPAFHVCLCCRAIICRVFMVAEFIRCA